MRQQKTKKSNPRKRVIRGGCEVILRRLGIKPASAGNTATFRATLQQLNGIKPASAGNTLTSLYADAENSRIKPA